VDGLAADFLGGLGITGCLFSVSVDRDSELFRQAHRGCVNVLLGVRGPQVEGVPVDVAKRWLHLNPGRKLKNGKGKEVTEQDIKKAAENPELMAKARAKLSSISDFQKRLLQSIAREMNRRDRVKGHFVAGRFQCNRIQCDAALLACSIYVALNPVRAGMGAAPEEHPYASFVRRCQEQAGSIAPLFLEERSVAYSETVAVVPEEAGGSRVVPSSNAFPCQRVSEKGYLPVTLATYRELANWTWKNLRSRGGDSPSEEDAKMPAGLEAILEKLSIAPRLWVDTIDRYERLFHRFVGSPEQLIAAANRLHTKYVKGIPACRERFAYQPTPSSTPQG